VRKVRSYNKSKVTADDQTAADLNAANMNFRFGNVYVYSFREKGSLALLSIHSDSEESRRSDVGFRASCQWRIESVDFETFLKATWQHEFRNSSLEL
jgi:uncharacterized protein with beta-barrel porin domain